MSIRTILFDLDGTLIDTNELIIASFQYTFQQYDMPLSREQAVDFIGPPLADTFHSAAETPEQAAEMVNLYRKHNIQHHDSYVLAFPYVIETLKSLHAKGLNLGVVTTKARQTVEKGMALTKIKPFFDVVITLDDVTHAKPHPEPVFQAMKQLDAHTGSTLMVGDNSHDIEAGHHAGVQTAGVAWSLKGEAKLHEYKPTYMLDDMRDLLSITEV